MRMKTLNTLLPILLLLGLSVQAFGQEIARDPISYQKKTLGTAFMCKGEKLKLNDLNALLDDDPLTADEVAAAKSRTMLGMVFGATGGALIGWPIGTSLGGAEDTNWNLAYAGGGLVVVAMVFASSAEGHYRNAVDIYNGGIRVGRLPSGTPLTLCVRGNGVGICGRF